MDNAVHSADGQTASHPARNTLSDNTASAGLQSLIDNLKYIDNTVSQPRLIDFIDFGRANHDALEAYLTRSQETQCMAMLISNAELHSRKVMNDFQTPEKIVNVDNLIDEVEFLHGYLKEQLASQQGANDPNGGQIIAREIDRVIDQAKNEARRARGNLAEVEYRVKNEVKRSGHKMNRELERFLKRF